MDKIKILHVLYELMPSGAEMMLYAAYPYWKDSCEMTILSTGPQEGVFADGLRKRGYNVDYLPIQEGALQGHESKRFKILHLIKFYLYLKQHSYDVVHVHKESLSENYIQLASLAGVKLCVRTIHNNFHFQGKLLKKKSISRAKSQTKYETLFIAISDGVMNNEKNVFGLECDYKIYNWCNNEKYHWITEEEKQKNKKNMGVDDKCILVTTGNCSKVKNHELLIRAIAKMHEKKSIMYYHIGYGKEEQQREEVLVNELGISECIQFVGFTDPLPYLEIADIYIMPSVFEGLSIAAIEAATVGTNLLLADTPGTIEFMNKSLPNVWYFHLDTADAISEENVSTLSIKLDELVKRWQCGELLNRKEQSEKTIELYSTQAGAQRYLQVYRKGLNR